MTPFSPVRYPAIYIGVVCLLGWHCQDAPVGLSHEKTDDIYGTDTTQTDDITVAIKTWPANKDIDVPLDAVIRISFNNHLDVDTVNNRRVSLVSGTIKLWLMMYYEPAKRELVVWSASPMRQHLVWEVYIEEGLKDVFGNSIRPGKLISFSTGERRHDALPFPDVTYDADISPVFETHCTTCHSGPAPFAGLDLGKETASLRRIVNERSLQWPGWRIIEPYRPGKSYLMIKLLNNDVSSGRQMPRAMDETIPPALTNAELETVSAWIAGGAVF